MEKEFLKQTELSWNKSIELNEVNSMAEYISDKWIIFSGDGNITTKEMFLQLVKNGDLVHTKMDFEILRVEVYGNTGLVMQRGTSAGNWQGQDFSNYEIASTVFIRENNKWQAVQTMIAPVPTQK
jgi:ketosteroid isomerase-like protein